MEITRLTTTITDRGHEYHREETLDDNFYWKRTEQHPISGDLVKRPLSPDEAEQMEHRYALLYSTLAPDAAPNLQEMLAEVTFESRQFMRREILLGGVLWYRRNEEAKSEKHRWTELPDQQQEYMEEVYQAFYAEKEDET